MTRLRRMPASANIERQENLTPLRYALHPWLPWLALGLMVGGLDSEALAFATGIAWLPATWWWAIGMPLVMLAVLLARRYP